MKPKKPCHYCQSTKADTEHDWRSYYVACPRCGSQGPKAKEEAEAIMLWDNGIEKPKAQICKPKRVDPVGRALDHLKIMQQGLELSSVPRCVSGERIKDWVHYKNQTLTSLAYFEKLLDEVKNESEVG